MTHKVYRVNQAVPNTSFGTAPTWNDIHREATDTASSGFVRIETTGKIHIVEHMEEQIDDTEHRVNNTEIQISSIDYEQMDLKNKMDTLTTENELLKIRLQELEEKIASWQIIVDHGVQVG